VRRAGREDGEHILDMDHADDRIELLAIDRQPAMPGLGEQGDEVGEAGLLLNRDDVRARHADIARVSLAEMEQVAHHLAFERGKVAGRVGLGIVLMRIDRLLELRKERKERQMLPSLLSAPAWVEPVPVVLGPSAMAVVQSSCIR